MPGPGGDWLRAGSNATSYVVSEPLAGSCEDMPSCRSCAPVGSAGSRSRRQVGHPRASARSAVKAKSPERQQNRRTYLGEEDGPLFVPSSAPHSHPAPPRLGLAQPSPIPDLATRPDRARRARHAPAQRPSSTAPTKTRARTRSGFR